MGGTERRSTAASSRRSAACGYRGPKTKGFVSGRYSTEAILSSAWTPYGRSAEATSRTIYSVPKGKSKCGFRRQRYQLGRPTRDRAVRTRTAGGPKRVALPMLPARSPQRAPPSCSLSLLAALGDPGSALANEPTPEPSERVCWFSTRYCR